MGEALMNGLSDRGSIPLSSTKKSSSLFFGKLELFYV